MAAVALVSLLTPSVEREGASWEMFSEYGLGRFCFDDGRFDRYAFRTAGPIVRTSGGSARDFATCTRFAEVGGAGGVSLLTAGTGAGGLVLIVDCSIVDARK